ncbi:MAG: EF-hand domain-containing protein [Defluviicoccus sp.]|nr:MAG: EF-hand domain-containing protein [Defluviicoccus sp.]
MTTRENLAVRQHTPLPMLACLTVAATLWATGTFAASEPVVTVLPNPMDLGFAYEAIAFEAADTNGNNLISEGEFVRDAAAGFAGLDANRDEKLTPDELGPHDPKLFEKVDTNGDGVLTFPEVMTYKMKAFRAADQNSDDALTFDEIVDSVKAELGE